MELVKERVDLRGILCPMNYVKTKLSLERIASGELLEVILDAGEAIDNVPRAVIHDGHEVVSIQPDEGAYRVTIKKR